jgi:hypothetical protein
MVTDNRSPIMNTTKTLMLAAVAALSLGAGTAMAQEGGPSMIGPNDWSIQQERAVYAHQTPAPTAAPVQAGSSDVDTSDHGLASGWVGDKSPYRFDYGTLDNPG